MQHFTQAEIRYIEDCYEDFLKEIRNKFDQERLARIEKAFRFANAAHDGIRRKSGEPYIIHPIAVAKIVAKDIGLGATSIVAAIFKFPLLLKISIIREYCNAHGLLHFSRQF